MSQEAGREEVRELRVAGLRPRAAWFRSFLHFLRAKPLGAVGLALVTLAVFVAIFAPWIAPYDPEKTFPGYRQVPPSSQFWFGTDRIGRDVFSRVIFGARVSLIVGLSVAVLGPAVGSLIGVTSAYLGKNVDLVVQRFIDTMLVFPTLVLALALMAVLGRSLLNVIVALILVEMPLAVRTVRSAALSIRETQYVDAARAIGASDVRIIFLHVLPNCFAPVIIVASAALGWAIVVEATLSFLGLGIPPNIPSWGGMLSGAAQRYVAVAPWLGIFPGLALSLTVFGINLLGDALRDVLDPRLRRD